jgi:four helix bundle protein
MIQSYRDLIVWQKSIDLCKKIYQLTASFPSDEKFGLTSQLRRASVSVPSNIAEGRSRRRAADFLRFLDYSYASLAEIETQLYIAAENGFTTHETLIPLFELCSEIGKMLNGLMNSLEKPLNAES